MHQYLHMDRQEQEKLILFPEMKMLMNMDFYLDH